MPPLQKENKSRQVNTDDLFLSETNVDNPEKLDGIENSMFFHLDTEKKIDTLLRDHEKKRILEELVSTKQSILFPEESFVEIRAPLDKKVETSVFHLDKKPQTPSYKKLMMPDECKTEFLMIHNPSFKFVSTLSDTEDVLLIKNPEDRHVEVIDLNALAAGSGTTKRKIEGASESKKDADTMQNKKVEVTETKKKHSKSYDSVFSAAQKSEEDSEKAKIYYLNSKNSDEKKEKDLGKNHSYIPVDFDDKIKNLKEKEQRELEKQKDTEQNRREKEQKEREIKDKRLQKLEGKKAQLEAKQKQKEEKKALQEKLKKEAKEKKLLQKNTKKSEETIEKPEVTKKEEKRLQKLERKQAKLEAKQKKKQEKEKLIKTLVQDAEEKKHIKKKTKHVECEEIKDSVFLNPIEPIKEQTFVDEDVIKVLLIADDLLGSLPGDVIDKFTKSEDFKLYEKVISKYKTK